MEIWVGVSWDFLLVKVILGLTLNQNCPFVKIKFVYFWWWGEWAEGCMFCENVCPFVSCESNMRPDMGIVCGGLPKQVSLSDLA